MSGSHNVLGSLRRVACTALAVAIISLLALAPVGARPDVTSAAGLVRTAQERANPGYFVGEYHWTRYYQVYGGGWRYQDCLYRWTDWPFNGGQGDRFILCQPWVYLNGAGYYV